MSKEKILQLEIIVNILKSQILIQEKFSEELLKEYNNFDQYDCDPARELCFMMTKNESFIDANKSTLEYYSNILKKLQAEELFNESFES